VSAPPAPEATSFLDAVPPESWTTPPDAFAAADSAAPPPRPGVSLPPTDLWTEPIPTSAEPPVVPAARPAVVGAGGIAGVLAAAARLGAKADVEHRAPEYLRTEEHARELLGARDKTVPPALGADDPPPRERGSAAGRSSRDSEAPAAPEQTGPPGIGADDTASAETGAGEGGLAEQARRHALRYGRELLGELRKTTPPAIGADDSITGPDSPPPISWPATPPVIGAGGEKDEADTCVTRELPRLPDLRPPSGRAGQPTAETLPVEATGDSPLDLPPIEPFARRRGRLTEPVHDTHVPPVLGAADHDEHR